MKNPFNKAMQPVNDKGVERSAGKDEHIMIKDLQRVADAAADMQHEIFDRTDCYHDNGNLRREFMQRPELLLLATIAKGLFDIADAIRDK